MPNTLLASYYDGRIRVLSGLIADAPDWFSKQVYGELLARYHKDRLELEMRDQPQLIQADEDQP
ncbi:hypothetical protein GG804_23940 [Sphingomonas histidinilytica]|uniref:hypothetical protein n=1 Tax=Rhizorhabdus histidinilytica TaxID=439228 RepID=UPI001ADCD98B|nr:hypothetical protein [Rhizorhabdus histidinilytica]MBO9379826.1 hypothetical protein [Rhizorhabdus histidinilytica]